MLLSRGMILTVAKRARAPIIGLDNACMIPRSISIVDAVVDRSVHDLERDLFRQAGFDDPPSLLPLGTAQETEIYVLSKRSALMFSIVYPA
jgi:hypothetical protein